MASRRVVSCHELASSDALSRRGMTSSGVVEWDGLAWRREVECGGGEQWLGMFWSEVASRSGVQAFWPVVDWRRGMEWFAMWCLVGEQ